VATDDQQVLVAGIASAPATFKIPGNGQIRPKAVYALYDGSGAATGFQPALKITSDGGVLIGIYPTTATVAAGGSANVSWFPGLGGGSGGALQAFLGARIQAGSTQTIATVTNTDLVYQTVYFDTDGMANLAADNRKLTVNTAGLYVVVCETVWAWTAASSGRRINVVIQNGLYSSGGIPTQFQSSDSRMPIWTADGTGGPTPYTTNTSVGLFQAATGDFFSSGCYQASGVNQTANGLSNCFLSALLIGV